MNTSESVVSESLEKAADLIDIGLSLVPGCADSCGKQVHWTAIQQFEAAGGLLLSIEDGGAESNQIDKAIETISLSLRRLTWLFMELSSGNYYPTDLAYNDTDNSIAENTRLSNADFVLQSIGDWLDSYENKLRVRSTKLRTVARRLAREAEKLAQNVAENATMEPEQDAAIERITAERGKPRRAKTLAEKESRVLLIIQNREPDKTLTGEQIRIRLNDKTDPSTVRKIIHSLREKGYRIQNDQNGAGYYMEH